MTDLRFAIRQLWKHKVSTFLAVLILALGIGGTTAVYSVADKVLLNPIPGRDADRLVSVREVEAVRNQRMEASPPLIEEIAGQSNLVESLTYYNEFYGGEEHTYHSGGAAVEVHGAAVGPNFFEVIGIRPLIGRARFAATAADATESEILIGYGFWQSQLGGDPQVIGRSLELDEVSHTVIGVMPSNVQFPYGPGKSDFWVPRRFSNTDVSGEEARQDRNWLTIAKLKPGVRLQEFQAMLDVLATRGRQSVNGPHENWTIQADAARLRYTTPSLRKTLWTLLAMIGALLLIAAANVGNLLLSRTLARRGELSVRIAIGAGRSRIARQLFVESAVLAGIAAFFSVFVAWGGVKALEQFYLDRLPRIHVIGLDWGVFAIAGLLALVVGILFGMAPAWTGSRVNVNQSLKMSERQHGGGAFQRVFHDLLVVTQVSLAVVLLTGAGLMTQSVIKLLRLDPGLNPKGLYRVLYKAPTFPAPDRAALEQGGDARRDAILAYSSRYLQWHESVVERLQAQPGIRAAAMNSSGPGGWSRPGYQVEGHEELLTLHRAPVGVRSGDFFQTIGATLIAGRWLNAADCVLGLETVLINEELARLCWPGESPLGKQFSQESHGEFQVVGVIRRVVDGAKGAEPKPTYYVPKERGNGIANRGDFIVRSDLSASAVRDMLAGVGREVVPRVEIASFHSVEELLLQSTAPQRVMMWLLLTLGAVGLVLSALGVFAVMAFAVTCRTHEIGVRMALGARQEQVRATFLRHGIRLVSGGLVLGVVVAFTVGRYIESLLYGVTTANPWVYAGVVLTLLFAGGVACWIPARRASRINPMEALRNE